MFEFDKIKYLNSFSDSVALIPARKGSIRIKKKNIKKLDGRPVISYSIKLAIQSKLFKTVIVSTDCKKIAKSHNLRQLLSLALNYHNLFSSVHLKYPVD